MTPKYLAVVPVDLFANQPMHYSSDGKTYKLWSVGLDGKDVDGTQMGNGVTVTMPRPPVKP